MAKRLPLVIQTIVYRRAGGGIEVLMLKRNPEKGGFWSVVNGTFEYGESLEQSRTRELREETSIAEVIGWSEELNRFSFFYQDYVIVVLCYAAEVALDRAAEINEEHTEYVWMGIEEASTMPKYEEDKVSLRALAQSLEDTNF